MCREPDAGAAQVGFCETPSSQVGKNFPPTTRFRDPGGGESDPYSVSCFGKFEKGSNCPEVLGYGSGFEVLVKS